MAKIASTNLKNGGHCLRKSETESLRYEKSATPRHPQIVPKQLPLFPVLEVNKVQTTNIDEEKSFRVELDSNADTCCVGGDVMIVNKTDRLINVTPFTQSLGSVKRVPIVSAAIAYEDPRSGKVYVLIIHQALHFPEITRSHLCPMQMRLNDVVINERPKFLTNHPADNYHAMIIDDLVIPLEIHKVASFFYGRKPTKKEYEECDRLELTSHSPNGVHTIQSMPKRNRNV
jgi:hypothetical protein